MKISQYLPLAALLFFMGCGTPYVLKPTPEESRKVAEYKLPFEPESQEALIYVTNWANDQRVRPIYFKIEDEKKIIEAEKFTIFRVKPGSYTVSYKAICRKVTGADLKAGIEATPPAFSRQDLYEIFYAAQDSKTVLNDEGVKLKVEAGKTYHIRVSTVCALNRYAGQYDLFGRIYVVDDETGRYLNYLTNKKPE